MTEYPSNYMHPKPSRLTSEYSVPGNQGTPSTSPVPTNPAKRAYKRLVESIFRLEKTLDEEHEIGARLISGDLSTAFTLQDIRYDSPDILCFQGRNGAGEELHLVQHVSQLNVILIAMKTSGDRPSRIGYKLQRLVDEEQAL